ncbi:MAG TPA: PD-(D/E)XK motif protein [Cyclobacteriaceae bacterium]|nr:PD-(D/E)XK motif protein [Cyclobacteriaceae bacterium]HMV08074.1 PD-(D/E)XK motif protein [Cyclobacteriaceae bacterium]HMV88290.1 PD-(D/E)XK motif protein [Cyclobacteriaceae bacterium]HMX00715.1 PD-(D/E)XK motif protein [Cyclobacteriaceae bacterium]HMX49410.1 PD-(D/E)XK motif protein [Cyclobacteriaceae bacterium]
MNLIGLYDSLSIPETDRKVFNATVIPEYPEFRLGIDRDGNAVLLLSINEQLKDSVLKNVRLKYLQLEQNVECSISENNTTRSQAFTVILFRSTDRNLQEYFLRVAETFIKVIGKTPSQKAIIDALKRIIEVFKALSESPTNTVAGLWGELFLIDNCKTPEVLIDYWHSSPEEKFDFNAGPEKVEVKSSSSLERSHVFSSEQLNPPEETQVLIASIFVRQQGKGCSIQQLIDNISEKISENFIAMEKLNSVVCATLANTLEYSLTMSFDYDLAKQSLKFYRHQDIDKIELINIPDKVSEVCYRSDMSSIQAAKIEDLTDADSKLFLAL